MTLPAIPPAPSPYVQYGALHDPFRQYGGYRVQVDPFSRYGGYAVKTSPDWNEILFHEKFTGLFQPWRYKVAYGGRGGLKTWAYARALLILGLKFKLRILCAREYMNTIDDSVHKVLKDQIENMGLEAWYQVEKKAIYGANGTEIKFIGLGEMANTRNRTRIKSYEGVDILWIEEAESISERTWEVTIPTIRKAGSEIWITYNPNLPTDPTYVRFHPDAGNVPANTLLIETNWRDNLWLTKELIFEKDHLFQVDPEAAAHVWDGQLRSHAEASIFADKCVFEAFETPRWDSGTIFRHGIDWGFAQDPLVLIRLWTTGKMPNEELWIDAEAWKPGVDINQMETFFDTHIPPLPGEPRPISSARRWPIKADSARPELISYLRGLGYNVSAAEKWEGSVEDGIAHIRGFKKIHVHTRCEHVKFESFYYKYKVDPLSGLVLPVVVDKHNHCWDAVRYALDGYIQRRGSLGVWAALGRM